jgi:hypothetical protein
MFPMLKTMLDDFIRVFQPPTPLKLAEEELDHAKRELLKAHSAEEYAHHMANYHEERINRLTLFINQQKVTTCQSNQSNSGTNVPAPTPLRKTSASNSDVTWKSSWK